MTSNIGARFIQKKGTLGFQANTDATREKVEEMVMSSVRQTFNPEFINRLDEIIIFDQLLDNELLEGRPVAARPDQQDDEPARVSRSRLTPKPSAGFVEKTCADRLYGARPIRRALQKYVEDPLSEALIQGQLEGATVVEVFLNGQDLDFRPEGVEAGRRRFADSLDSHKRHKKHKSIIFCFGHFVSFFSVFPLVGVSGFYRL
jgi:ATP-dependent Clp protease ATP-binding subunit ClpC